LGLPSGVGLPKNAKSLKMTVVDTALEFRSYFLPLLSQLQLYVLGASSDSPAGTIFDISNCRIDIYMLGDKIKIFCLCLFDKVYIWNPQLAFFEEYKGKLDTLATPVSMGNIFSLRNEVYLFRGVRSILQSMVDKSILTGSGQNFKDEITSKTTPPKDEIIPANGVEKDDKVKA
jgi:hypothetical protein